MHAQPCVIVRIDKRMAEFFCSAVTNDSSFSTEVESERHTSLVSKIKRSAPPLANFGTSPAAALPASLPNAF